MATGKSKFPLKEAGRKGGEKRGEKLTKESTLEPKRGATQGRKDTDFRGKKVG